jgi:hypothetical protein
MQPLTMRIIDDLPSNQIPVPPVLQGTAWPREQWGIRYQFMPEERGDHLGGRVYLRYASAAGLAERWAYADLTQTVRVSPRMLSPREDGLFLARSRQIEMQRRKEQLRGQGREFENGLPGLYMVGIIFLFSTQRCQRLEDMVAGTIVVHERRVTTPMWDGNAARTFTTSLSATDFPAPSVRPTGLPADVIAKLTLADVEVIESFDARRLDLPVEAGDALAAQLAAKMNTGLPAVGSAVDFLAGLAFERRSMGSRSAHRRDVYSLE